MLHICIYVYIKYYIYKTILDESSLKTPISNEVPSALRKTFLEHHVASQIQWQKKAQAYPPTTGSVRATTAQVNEMAGGCDNKGWKLMVIIQEDTYDHISNVLVFTLIFFYFCLRCVPILVKLLNISGRLGFSYLCKPRINSTCERSPWW